MHSIGRPSNPKAKKKFQGPEARTPPVTPGKRKNSKASQFIHEVKEQRAITPRTKYISGEHSPSNTRGLKKHRLRYQLQLLVFILQLRLLIDLV